MVTRKTPDELQRMATAGALLRQLHDHLAPLVRPGATTAELEAAAQRFIADHGAQPSFSGSVEQGHGGFPTALCTSVNDAVVHGVPDHRRLRAGDVLSIDAGVKVAGVHSDAARTHVVGGDRHAGEHTRELIEGTRQALWAGIAAMRVGNRVGDISAAIATVAATHGLGIIADHDGHVLGGHGIGRSLHEDPHVPNRGMPGRGLRLKPGLVLAIEPMFTLGGAAWRVDPRDGWTVRTQDGSLAAHEEHTVAVTEHGPWVLTASQEEVAAHLVA